MQIVKAERASVRFQIAFAGPSGSGKTMSALGLATRFGPRVLLIDTENKSARNYAGDPQRPREFEFDTIDLTPPYTVQRYVDAIKMALDGNYDVVVIDSITHEWDGEGGLLETKGQLDRVPGSNSFTNWDQITEAHKKFIGWLLKLPCDVIVTMRSKQDYIVTEGTNASGKSVQKPVKIGLNPIQRPGTEYEFGIVFDIDMGHNMTTSKDRTGLFDGKVLLPDLENPKVRLDEMAAILLAWRQGAAVDDRVESIPDAPPAMAPARLPVQPVQRDETGGSAPPPANGGGKPNQYAGPCLDCGVQVEVGAGFIRKNAEGKWKNVHRPGQCQGGAPAKTSAAPATTSSGGAMAERGRLVNRVVELCQQFGLQGKDQIRIAKAKFRCGLSDASDAQLGELCEELELALSSPAAKMEFLRWFNSLGAASAAGR